MTATPQDGGRAAALDSLLGALKAIRSFDDLRAVARQTAPSLRGLDAAPVAPPEATVAKLLSNPHAGSLAALLLIDLCAAGSEAALERCTSLVATRPDAAELFVPLGRLLDEAQLARDVPAEGLRRLARAHAGAFTRISALLAWLQFLGMSKAAPLAARLRVFHEVAVPRMRAAATAGQDELMLAIEHVAYENCIKTVEAPDHHTACLAAIEAAYAALPATAPPPMPPIEERPRVALLIPNGAILAHTEVMLAFLDGLAQLEAPPLDPIVVIYADPQGGELGRRLTERGVAWEALPAAGGRSACFKLVRERMASLQVHAVAFVSLPMHIAYFARRPLAPAQIWWSMKFPLPNFAELDGRVFYRALFAGLQEVEGRTWRGGPLAFNAPPTPPASAVEAIRARHPGKVILGTVAREEKIANAEYLAAVVEILRRRPETCFLWTGRSQMAEIVEAFREGGVADRCHFVGWVDPAPYIMAFDLFLETYPLTGLMCGWAMAWGKPLVSVGEMGFLGACVGPVLDGSAPAAPAELARLQAVFEPVARRLPGLWARRPHDMVAMTEALLEDPELRSRLGAVQKAYVEGFMTDAAGSARIQAAHFADIAREVSAARAPPLR